MFGINRYIYWNPSVFSEGADEAAPIGCFLFRCSLNALVGRSSIWIRSLLDLLMIYDNTCFCFFFQVCRSFIASRSNETNKQQQKEKREKNKWLKIPCKRLVKLIQKNIVRCARFYGVLSSCFKLFYFCIMYYYCIILCL